MAPNDRLKEAREKRGFSSATAAAKAYGWNVNSYRSHENGTREITLDAALKYGAALGFSLDWLYKGGAGFKVRGLSTVTDVAYTLVPRLRSDFMKNYGGLEKAMEKATDFSSLPQHLNLKLPAVAMIIDDDSMLNVAGGYPSFKKGDEIIFSLNEDIRPGDFVLAEVIYENTVVFRQYRERGRNSSGFMTFELAPLNDAFETKLVTQIGQIQVVARMTHRIESFI